MTTSDNKIIRQLDKNNNVLVYKQELDKLYQRRNKTIKSAYIISPRRGKEAFKLIHRTVHKNDTTKNKTISQLIEEIIETKSTLHIYVDYFEQLTKRELDYYRQLESKDNIQLIVNIRSDEAFIDESFLEKFIKIDAEGYSENRSHSTNITYTILLLISLLIFLVFMRLQLSILSILVNTLWFTLLMYRSFTYMVR